MANPDPLRPSTPNPGNTPPPLDLSGQQGRPLPAGVVKVTDHTRKQLEAVGWQEGDPLPGDLGERLQQMRQETLSDATPLQDLPIAAGWKPVSTSFVDITSLPPEKQSEIQEYLADYKSQMAQQQQAAEAEANLESAVPGALQGDARRAAMEHMRISEAALAARQESTGVVIDDRPAAEDLPPPSSPPLAEGSETAPDAEPLGAASFAEQPAATRCTRCSWPSDVPFEVTATSEDKRNFLMSVLGNTRFRKTYSLINGQVEVVFRSLLTSESLTLHEQLGEMVRSGRSAGPAEYMVNMSEFRLVLGTERVTSAAGTLYTGLEMSQWAAGAGVNTDIMSHFREQYYSDKGIKSEPLRRILGEAHEKFQRLVELLEVQASSSDFWKGIEPQG